MGNLIVNYAGNTITTISSNSNKKLVTANKFANANIVFKTNDICKLEVNKIGLNVTTWYNDTGTHKLLTRGKYIQNNILVNVITTHSMSCSWNNTSSNGAWVNNWTNSYHDGTVTQNWNNTRSNGTWNNNWNNSCWNDINNTVYNWNNSCTRTNGPWVYYNETHHSRNYTTNCINMHNHYWWEYCTYIYNHNRKVNFINIYNHYWTRNYTNMYNHSRTVGWVNKKTCICGVCSLTNITYNNSGTTEYNNGYNNAPSTTMWNNGYANANSIVEWNNGIIYNNTQRWNNGWKNNSTNSVEYATHTWSSTWNYNAENHWHICTVCNSGTNAIAAHTWANVTTYVSIDNTYHNTIVNNKCSICAYNSVTTTAQKHNWNNFIRNTSINATHHYKNIYNTCNNCTYNQVASTSVPHSWNSIKHYETINATHHYKNMYNKCKYCSYYEQVASTSESHSWNSNISYQNYNATHHYKNIYSECNYCTYNQLNSNLVSHLWRYIYNSPTQHLRKCSYCNFNAVLESHYWYHNTSYINISNTQHNKQITSTCGISGVIGCGYNTSTNTTENHTWSNTVVQYFNISNTQHNVQTNNKCTASGCGHYQIVNTAAAHTKTNTAWSSWTNGTWVNGTWGNYNSVNNTHHSQSRTNTRTNTRTRTWSCSQACGYSYIETGSATESVLQTGYATHTFVNNICSACGYSRVPTYVTITVMLNSSPVFSASVMSDTNWGQFIKAIPVGSYQGFCLCDPSLGENYYSAYVWVAGYSYCAVDMSSIHSDLIWDPNDYLIGSQNITLYATEPGMPHENDEEIGYDGGSGGGGGEGTMVHWSVLDDNSVTLAYGEVLEETTWAEYLAGTSYNNKGPCGLYLSNGSVMITASDDGPGGGTSQTEWYVTDSSNRMGGVYFCGAHVPTPC